MSEYTPTSDEIREQYVAGAMVTGFAYSLAEARTEFDRWLAGMQAEAKSAALEAYASGLEIRLAGATRRYGQAVIEGHDIVRELRDRAEQYRSRP